MKIVHVTKYFHPHRGGIESNVLGLSEGLSKKGMSVSVFTSNVPKSEQHDKLEMIEILRSTNIFTSFNTPFAPGIFLDLLRKDYDIIHMHLPDPPNSMFALVASKMRRKPLVVTYHADIIKDKWYHKPFTFFYNLILAVVLRNSEKIIATTPNYVEASGVLKKFNDSIEIVPNFTDAERFNPEVDGKGIREKYGLEKRGVILFVGRLIPYKGVEYIIRAFSAVEKEVNGASLLIVGDGPLWGELENLVKELNLKNVVFAGMAADEELPGYYAACDLFVLPSINRAEAFGITLLEAMATGKPCITTNISGMPYVVGDCGALVEPKDVEGLKNAMVRFIGDKKLLKEKGVLSRKRVEEMFTVDKVVEKTLDIYKRILS